MPWGRLDDTLYDHPKLDGLGRDRLAGIGLWVLAISWCNRHLTDGLLPLERVLRLGGTKGIAEKLVTAGLFDREDDGYAVHDFLAFNPSRTEVEEDRRLERERWRRRRSEKNSGGYSNGGSTKDSGVESGGDSLARTSGGAGAPRPPVPLHPPPRDARVPVDEREWTEEQRQAAYIASQSKRTNVQ